MNRGGPVCSCRRREKEKPRRKPSHPQRTKLLRRTAKWKKVEKQVIQ